MSKNCCNCAYEPDWYIEDERTCKLTYGWCQFPVPFWLTSPQLCRMEQGEEIVLFSGENVIHSKVTKMKCKAWKAKA